MFDSLDADAQFWRHNKMTQGKLWIRADVDNETVAPFLVRRASAPLILSLDTSSMLCSPPVMLPPYRPFPCLSCCEWSGGRCVAHAAVLDQITSSTPVSLYVSDGQNEWISSVLYCFLNDIGSSNEYTVRTRNEPVRTFSWTWILSDCSWLPTLPWSESMVWSDLHDSTLRVRVPKPEKDSRCLDRSEENYWWLNLATLRN
jgi:hypothetical protein